MKKILLASLIFLSALPMAMAQTNMWTDTFSLYVTKIALPSVSTNALTINVAEGETATADLILSNTGNVAVDFTLVGNAISTNSPYADYQRTYLTENSESFVQPQFKPETVFSDSDWDGDSTISLDLGFATTIFGNTYTNFIVNLDGSMQLTDGNAGVNITPGYTGEDFEPTWVRHKKYTDRLVIAWGVDPSGSVAFDPGELQIWIHANGTVQFLYSRGGDSSTAWYSVLRTPQTWISASPTTGTVPGGGSIPVTFTFNADSQPAGTEPFSCTVVWSNGDTTNVTVNAVISGSTQQLDLPADPTFYGPAGLITSTNIVVTNSGNTALSYTIGYPTGGYTAQQIDYANNWISGGTVVPSADLGSESFAIDFPFTFFGNVYTSLMINEDGSITLDSDHIIRVFANDLQADQGATVTLRKNIAQTRAVITWNKFSQSGSLEDYTFQVILNRDGTIRGNYFQLASDWTSGVINITDGTTNVVGSLFNEDTVSVTTNEETYIVSTNFVSIGNGEPFPQSYNYATNITVTTTYTNIVSLQSIQFTPSARQVISASPTTGTIEAGETAVIKLTGDARSLADGGSTDVTTNTTLSFVYSGNTNTLDVTFIATNSVDAAYPSLAPAELASMWGTSYVPNIWTEQDELGTARAIAWPAPEDGLSRTYMVWYTTSLAASFEPIEGAVFTNGYLFVDEDPERINSAQGFYKVSVE